MVIVTSELCACDLLSLSFTPSNNKIRLISVLYNTLNKTFMEVDGIRQLNRFHCLINYGTQIVSLKKLQSAANIWNCP